MVAIKDWLEVSFEYRKSKQLLPTFVFDFVGKNGKFI